MITCHYGLFNQKYIRNKKVEFLAKILGKIQVLDFITSTKDLLSKTWSNAILRHFLTQNNELKNFEEKRPF